MPERDTGLSGCEALIAVLFIDWLVHGMAWNIKR